MRHHGYKLILAPMAGFSDQPFRRLARAFGADEVVTELISANALVRSNRKTRDMARLHPEERPAAIQIFGSDPAVMAEAARMVEEFQPLFMDLNMGCPAKKVTRNGAGAALLDDPQLAGEIVRRVVNAVKTPVSVKIRTGKYPANKTGLEVARLAAEHGAKRITLHARTVADGFSGPLDLDAAAHLKRTLDVEVIGNGNILTAQDARTWLERTGCDGLMIGRGAVGHPSVFREIREGRERAAAEDVETVLLHTEWMEAFYGQKGVGPMRGHLMYYSKGLDEAKRFRRELVSAETFGQLRAIIARYFVKTAECAA